MRTLWLFGCMNVSPGSQRPECGYCSLSHLSLHPASYPGLGVCQRRDRGKEERTPTFPERRDECQSNSATCADIKHYCILTFHLCSAQHFCKVPQRSLRMALCLCAVRGLIDYSHISLFPFCLRRYVRADD